MEVSAELSANMKQHTAAQATLHAAHQLCITNKLDSRLIKLVSRTAFSVGNGWLTLACESSSSSSSSEVQTALNLMTWSCAILAETLMDAPDHRHSMIKQLQTIAKV